tara:strand:+ start:60 stop:332 length:273 start_codon:yes stop_codon:yes gene_type:complete
MHLPVAVFKKKQKTATENKFLLLVVLFFGHCCRRATRQWRNNTVVQQRFCMSTPSQLATAHACLPTIVKGSPSVTPHPAAFNSAPVFDML